MTATCTSPLTASTISVTWTGVTAATSYTVYESTSSASTGYSTAASQVTTTSWTSETLKSGHTYWFEVATSIGATWHGDNSIPTTGLSIKAGRPPNCQ